MKIAIIGASGFLGKNIFQYFSRKHQVVGTYSQRKIKGLEYLDVTNKKNVEKFIFKYSPEVVIDTIGWANLFLSESNPEKTKLINYHTAKNLEEVCKTNKIPMIFFSSSYIFDGNKGNYSEKDVPNPKSQYGKTKVMAENEVLKLKNSIVIRIDRLYGYNSGNEVEDLLGVIFSGENPIKVRDYLQIRSPTLVDDVGPVILKLLKDKK